MSRNFKNNSQSSNKHFPISKKNPTPISYNCFQSHDLQQTHFSKFEGSIIFKCKCPFNNVQDQGMSGLSDTEHDCPEDACTIMFSTA